MWTKLFQTKKHCLVWTVCKFVFEMRFYDLEPQQYVFVEEITFHVLKSLEFFPGSNVHEERMVAETGNKQGNTELLINAKLEIK